MRTARGGAGLGRCMVKMHELCCAVLCCARCAPHLGVVLRVRRQLAQAQGLHLLLLGAHGGGARSHDHLR